jgi:hypothetical protein
MIYANSTNESIYNQTEQCLWPHTSKSLSEYLDCYSMLTAKDRTNQIFQICLIVFIIITNIFVICIICLKSLKFNVFDEILVNHCIIQGVTGLIDVPFFHIKNVFKYFPCGQTIATMWAIYDNNINTITNLNMLYLSWVRLRSIVAPQSFKNEILIRKPIIVLMSIWIFGLTAWSIIIIPVGVIENTLNVDISNKILVALNLIFWILPLLTLLLMSFIIIKKLYWTSANRKRLLMEKSIQSATTMTSAITTVGPTKTTKTKKATRTLLKEKILTPHGRFLILFLIYFTQWIIPAIVVLTDLACDCIPQEKILGIYWLTYSVCLTDPCLIFLLNPNLKLKYKIKTST